MPICSRCKTQKSGGEFYRQKNHKNGLMSKCKTCSREYFNAWRLAKKYGSLAKAPPGQKFCTKCKNTKPLAEFAHCARKDAKPHHAQYQSRCRECDSGGFNGWRTFLRNYKLEKGCSVCGFNKHYVALDFDHHDPANKTFSLNSWPGSWEKLYGEITKCNVLCANCHRIKTAANRDGTRGRKRKSTKATLAAL